ncbi:MAG: universal stress protein [Bacteroidia bacterium]
MKRQLKIFLATDYSQAVINAERYAIELAKTTKSFLTILHVYEIPFSFPSEPSEYAKATEDLRKYELKKLEQHYETLLSSLDLHAAEVNCECIVLEGIVGRQIRKEAERAQMDVIITGTHGASGFRKFFLGSHTWDVIKKSKIPVMAIPKDAILTGIKNIVFATAYKEGDISGIHFLVQFAKVFNAALTILHITNHSLSKDFEALAFKKFKTEIQSKVSYDKLSLRLAYYDDVIEGLNNFCTSSKTDLLVMSHVKPFFLDNIFPPTKNNTKEMTFHTHIPLLTVPDFYVPENTEFN